MNAIFANDTALPGGTICQDGPTAIECMHQQVIQLRDAGNDRALPDAEAEALHLEMMDLADAIVDVPATSFKDMLLKFMAHTINGDHDTEACPRSDELWAEARAMIGGAA